MKLYYFPDNGLIYIPNRMEAREATPAVYYPPPRSLGGDLDVVTASI